MKKILAAIALMSAIALAAVSSPATAAGMPDMPCKRLTDVPQADDANYQVVGIRRPALATPLSVITVDVNMKVEHARMDAGGVNGTVEAILACQKGNGYLTVYQVRTVRQGEWDVTQIPLPKAARDVRIFSCSGKTGECWRGIYTGEAGVGVTLVAPPKIDPKF